MVFHLYIDYPNRVEKYSYSSITNARISYKRLLRTHPFVTPDMIRVENDKGERVDLNNRNTYHSKCRH